MSADFGNEQDISVHDKTVASMGPTEEAQDVDSLNRIVVPMGAFADPHNPMTNSGSVNLPLDTHPVTHSADYGQSVEPGIHVTEVGNENSSPLAVGAATLTDDDATRLELPDNREEWTKADWQKVAKHYGLPTSGNTDTIQQRVEDHENEQEAIDARSKELHAMHRDELDNLASEYGIDPAEHSTKDDLAEAILSAEREQD